MRQSILFPLVGLFVSLSLNASFADCTNAASPPVDVLKVMGAMDSGAESGVIQARIENARGLGREEWGDYLTYAAWTVTQREQGDEAAIAAFEAISDEIMDGEISKFVYEWAIDVAAAMRRANRLDEARTLLQRVAMNQSCPLMADRARSQYLGTFWSAGQYDDFLDAYDMLPVSSSASDGGLADLRAGYIWLRLNQDAERARFHFQQAATASSEYGVEAGHAADWAALLIEAVHEEGDVNSIRSMMEGVIRGSQGGAAREINAISLARRTLQFAEGIRGTHPEGAVALADAVAADPVFGIFQGRAKLMLAELQDGDIASAAELAEREDAAYQVYRSAISKSRQRDYAGSINEYRQILELYPDSAVARDAVLRIGFIHTAAGNREEAIASFLEAIEHNIDLGLSHPFNLDALYRLKQHRHGQLYETRRHSFDLPESNPDNAALVQAIHDQLMVWEQAIPTDSPDRELALIEQGGALFESAKAAAIDAGRGPGFEAPVEMDTVRDFLNDQIIEDDSISLCSRALAALMHLETYAFEHNHEQVVLLTDGFADAYPECWREIGTALVFRRHAFAFLEDWQSVRETTSWIRANIPLDAPRFRGTNYHAAALLSDAALAWSEGKDEEADALRMIAEEMYPGDRQFEREW